MENKKALGDEHLKSVVFVIFGGAGDLTWRKLIPALFDLSRDRDVPNDFSIIGVDSADMNDEAWRKRLHDGVDRFSRYGVVRAKQWHQFALHISYLRGDFTNPETYISLKHRIEKLEKDWNNKTERIFYMATPFTMFSEIPKYLSEVGLVAERNHARIVVEKPIGHNLDSAREINNLLSSSFHESQIFRMNHYLGKETIQNVLAFRFANPFFEPIWNRRYVDYVTITVAEEEGIGHRFAYYEKTGAMRDMVQNHLMQLFCLVAMEPMVSFDADEIRNKKVDVLHAVRPIPINKINQFAVRGQYDRGKINDREVNGYRKEHGVLLQSQTETFVALKLLIDNWRWQNVPFYLRTGKRLARQLSEIVIQFRPVPNMAFPKEAISQWQPSRIIISILPDESISLRFYAKQPGSEMLLKPVDMSFNYRDNFTGPFAYAYETLLWDLMQNDATQFMRADQVEAAWQILMPVLEVWSENKTIFPNYKAGSWGPKNAEKLLSQQGHSWGYG